MPTWNWICGPPFVPRPLPAHSKVKSAHGDKQLELSSLPPQSRSRGPLPRRHRRGCTQDAFLSGRSFRRPERKRASLLTRPVSMPEIIITGMNHAFCSLKNMRRAMDAPRVKCRRRSHSQPKSQYIGMIAAGSPRVENPPCSMCVPSMTLLCQLSCVIITFLFE